MYFEFSDARRIHAPYQDIYTKLPVWKAPVYNSPYLNWKRGIYSVTPSILLLTPIYHFKGHVEMLSLLYEWPNSRIERGIFLKEIFRMDGFWKEMGKKMSFNFFTAYGDTAVKLSMWQYIYGGTNSPDEFADYNSYKPFFCGLAAFGPTAFLTVPFENARRAYYADKTWPVELRRNYRSPLAAFFRIPFEEGPTYLFKGGFPLWTNQMIFWTMFVSIYIFLKNKFFFLWLYNDISYDWCKFCFINMSFFPAMFAAYPCYYTREMVDLWPKERGGFCTWNNNYRTCLKWMTVNWDMHYLNVMKGSSLWFQRYGLQYWFSIWIADSMGMFSNCNESYNSQEAIFPGSAESI
mmetsp:Transcript_8811/g.14940  ORF Transcript_8811/g.14940 Transcript_8811/m.14940 type:complete len:349 (-) Transcript_8811:176-1222(-)